MTEANPFKKKGDAPKVHAGAFENAVQAADSLLAAHGDGSIDEVRARVHVWIGDDPERAAAVTREYYAKCDKGGALRLGRRLERF